MGQSWKVPQEGALDLVSLGAVVHRLDPGVIPFRNAVECRIHVSGGEFNVAANLADCFGLPTASVTAMADCFGLRTATPHPPQPVILPRSSMRYPRIYTGRQLAMLAMPLGGIAAGSISLGGRGQLRDWELFNRPDKGRSPEYAFASIWAQAGSRKPVAHVLEARLMPPYEGPDGLGSKNAPGLSRLEGATFTGELPIAQTA